jgi:hypothetical protein
VFDVTAAATSARVRVAISDDRSGVRAVEAFLIGPHSAYSQRIHLRLTAGTDRRGTWTGTIPLPACTSPAGRWRLYLNVTDRALNWAPELHGVTVEIAALDHVRPVSDDPYYPRSVTDPVRFTFSEDVTNLSAGTVEVFALTADAPAGTVTGVWSCTDAAGRPADCAAGAFRAAAFVPDAPWVAGREYRVNFARDGTAGVMDMVGNPLESELTMYFDVRPNG